jgi:hypothetical protein
MNKPQQPEEPHAFGGDDDDLGFDPNAPAGEFDPNAIRAPFAAPGSGAPLEEDERVSMLKRRAPPVPPQQHSAQKVEIIMNGIKDLYAPQKEQLKSKYPLGDRVSLALTQCFKASISPRS